MHLAVLQLLQTGLWKNDEAHLYSFANFPRELTKNEEDYYVLFVPWFNSDTRFIFLYKGND